MANPSHIVDPFPNAQTSWTFADHKQHGFTGGTDKEVAPGVLVRAAAAGTARLANDGLNGVEIEYAKGKFVTQRENAHVVGKFPRKVKLDEAIAVSGRDGTKYPHIDITIDGRRLDIEDYYFTPLTKAQVKAAVDKAFLDYKGRKASRASHLLWDGRIYRTNSDLHLLRVKLRDAK